ncbi:hypothetical protein BHE74_00015998 [Ensete ventricosum]|nr:hypothetical protein GW17_00054874 [Ensete ventricosum]RWW75931.1 hypothetical protein BHE74_00015998 [Ensete ventricosum]
MVSLAVQPTLCSIAAKDANDIKDIRYSIQITPRSHEGELHRKHTVKSSVVGICADTRPHKRRSPDKSKLMATNCGGWGDSRGERGESERRIGEPFEAAMKTNRGASLLLAATWDTTWFE